AARERGEDMTRSSAVVGGIGIALLLVGCGEDVSSGTGGSGPGSSSSGTASSGGAGGSGATGGAGVGGQGGVAGAGAGGAGCVATDGLVLAVDKLFIGDTDTNGAVSSSAWKQFGFDIDGKVS